MWDREPDPQGHRIAETTRIRRQITLHRGQFQTDFLQGVWGDSCGSAGGIDIAGEGFVYSHSFDQLCRGCLEAVGCMQSHTDL